MPLFVSLKGPGFCVHSIETDFSNSPCTSASFSNHSIWFLGTQFCSGALHPRAFSTHSLPVPLSGTVFPLGLAWSVSLLPQPLPPSSKTLPCLSFVIISVPKTASPLTAACDVQWRHPQSWGKDKGKNISFAGSRQSSNDFSQRWPAASVFYFVPLKPSLGGLHFLCSNL